MLIQDGVGKARDVIIWTLRLKPFKNLHKINLGRSIQNGRLFGVETSFVFNQAPSGKFPGGAEVRTPCYHS